MGVLVRGKQKPSDYGQCLRARDGLLSGTVYSLVRRPVSVVEVIVTHGYFRGKSLFIKTGNSNKWRSLTAAFAPVSFRKDKSVSTIVDRRRSLHVKEEKNGVAGHVYVCSLGYDNLYKIGMTTNLSRRMSDLGASNPKLKCIFSAMTTDAAKAERALHRIYKGCHVQREIFKIKHVDTKWLNRVIRKYYQNENSQG